MPRSSKVGKMPNFFEGLLCVSPWSSHFTKLTNTSYSTSLYYHCPILEMRKRRPREVKEHAEGHLVSNKQMDWNQVFWLQSPTGLSTTAPHVFI